MTGGWFSGAPPPTLFGLHIQARLVAVGSFFSNEQRQFSSEGRFRYNAEQVEGLLAESGISSDKKS